MLNDAQRRALLRLARQSVDAHVRGLPPPVPDSMNLPHASGVFVSLKQGNELRGCLGTLQCRNGLAHDVVRCAADAASLDPRFPPVGREELDRLALEVSVLGPLEGIDPRADDAIVIGRHGLVVERGGRRGLLLPQVPVEWGWTREQFLRQTCAKAGLPDDAWERGASLYRFEAEVFRESAD